jgi:ferritin-like metal-binding protein YciE
MKEDYTDEVKDAAIIGAAQRVEHYEMAGYGTVRAIAELLGESEDVSLLEQTLEEEKQADQKLTELAEDINPKAAEGEEEAKGTTEPAHGTRGGSKSKRAA